MQHSDCATSTIGTDECVRVVRLQIATSELLNLHLGVELVVLLLSLLRLQVLLVTVIVVPKISTRDHLNVGFGFVRVVVDLAGLILDSRGFDDFRSRCQLTNVVLYC